MGGEGGGDTVVMATGWQGTIPKRIFSIGGGGGGGKGSEGLQSGSMSESTGDGLFIPPGMKSGGGPNIVPAGTPLLPHTPARAVPSAFLTLSKNAIRMFHSIRTRFRYQRLGLRPYMTSSGMAGVHFIS